MRALRSGHHFLRGSKGFRWRELNRALQAEGLAADHFQPSSPDGTAWPVARSRTGAEAHRTLAVSEGGEESERAASSGHTTALTRRGFRVVLLS